MKMVMRVAVPDLISNSYFPAIAAIELGFFARQGLDATLAHIFPSFKAFEAVRDGTVDFVAGPAHGALFAFPGMRGGKFLAALAQGTYWMLVMRSDLRPDRGDLSIVTGKRIAAVPVVELGLRLLLTEAGIDAEKSGVQIVPVPGADEAGVSSGVAAAKALGEAKIDGFWANATGAEVAVRRGVGSIVLDVRRGDGPPAAFHYTFPAFATSDRVIEGDPAMVAAAVRAIVETQQALKQDVQLAAEVGRKLFPREEAGLIADVVARDLPYYDAAIPQSAIAGLNGFARQAGLLADDVRYDDAVATQFSHLWAV
jgi:ABC-type nitrate/sulfonate/bicarbonate transport system substrate-binding protein